ncbi:MULTISPECIES: AraC family transcriptional regulator [unclassified Rhizobium]|uniref:AraC family transcriptional regulator n=1 Tax=unclassified Rhizobium TaxID=2613769 RepID=UPI00288BF28F|nr:MULTISPECIES: AraC family transcriptional regulator [unclassified Rhizobium]
MNDLLFQILKAMREVRYQIFSSEDFHEVAHRVCVALSRHHMEIAEGQLLDAALHEVEVGGLRLIYLRYGADVKVVPQAVPDHVLFQVVLRGTMTLEENGQIFEAGAGSGIIIENLDRCRLSYSADCEQLIIPVKRCMLAIASERIGGKSVPRSFGFARVFPLIGEDDPLVSLLHYLLQQFARDKRVLDALSAPFEITLAYELVAGHSSVTCEAVPPGAVPACVYAAERFMSVNLQRDIGLEELAKLVGTPSRTLSYSFQRFRNKSPLQALREKRLDRIRELLVTSQAASVTEVALQYQFNHVGRLAAFYKLRFGETPSQTLQRASHEAAWRQASQLAAS